VRGLRYRRRELHIVDAQRTPVSVESSPAPLPRAPSTMLSDANSPRQRADIAAPMLSNHGCSRLARVLVTVASASGRGERSAPDRPR
jgi:hypothetical protein